MEVSMSELIRYEYYGFANPENNAVISPLNDEECTGAELALRVELIPRSHIKAGEAACQFGNVQVAEWAKDLPRVKFLLARLDRFISEKYSVEVVSRIERS
jgi:hypothetical protein